MDLFFILLIFFAIGAAMVGLAVKILVFGFLLKAGAKAYQQHQQRFDRSADQLQQLLLRQGGSGSLPSLGAQQQFMSAWFNAQNQLGQLDDLRRQRSELRLADLRSQAASAGLFLD